MIFMGIMSQTVFAGNSASVLSGTVTIADTLGTLVEEGGIVTVTVTSTRDDESENIITITNNATYKAKLSFAYSLTEVQEHDFDASNGTYTVVLDTGESVTLRIFRDWGQAKTGTLTMSDFSLIEAATEAEVLSQGSALTLDYFKNGGGTTPPAATVYRTLEKEEGWKCTICGYIAEKDELPDGYRCPLCRAGKDKFVKL